LSGKKTRAKTELGAAQKDTTREIGAKLASLKGIVWVGVALFTFGLASLFYPPLKLLIGSVTTSLAVVLGGLALMVSDGLAELDCRERVAYPQRRWCHSRNLVPGASTWAVAGRGRVSEAVKVLTFC
jgi:hypothetical protein